MNFSNKKYTAKFTANNKLNISQYNVFSALREIK